MSVIEPIQLNLRDIYRSADVKRWQIVKIARPQSVAEHSYMVAMIAARICEILELPRNVRDAAVAHALTHDLPEVVTGDVASPLKAVIGEGRTYLREFEERMRFPGFTDDQPPYDTQVHRILKAADLIEAVKFLRENAMTDHGRDVEAKIYKRIREYGVPAYEQALNEILSAKQTYLDEIDL
ncbi:MAG: putative hydrolase of HD superfamily [Caudoviricetes sp.]|nr:MAG: putative hydrolase of HD superfamily [Caudoviricetes sp.]